MWTGSLSVALALLAPPVGEAPQQPAASARDYRGNGFLSLARRGYLHIAPGAMWLQLSPQVAPRYAWGISGGGHWRIMRRLIGEAGAFVDHVRVSSDYARYNLFGLGLELRVGGGTPWIVGYGLVRVGLWTATYPAPQGPAADLPRTGHVLAGLLTLGCGLQGLVHRHAALGVEPAFDWMLGKSDAVALRLRLFVSVLF